MKQRRRLNHTASRRASALMLALAMLSLVAFTLVSLAVVTREHIIEEGIRRNDEAARENAFFALHLALAQLQEYAGKDRMATAQARIQGDQINHTYWTGVWDEAGKVNWLVSAAISDVVDPPIGEEIRILNTGTQSVFIDAIELPADMAGGGFPGRIGWWTSDEGVKAAIGQSPELEHEDVKVERRNRQIVSQKHNGKAVFDTWQDIQLLEKITHFEQIKLLPSVSGIESTEVDKLYHDITAENAFVLSNGAEGGLRRDLTHLVRSGDPGLYADPLINAEAQAYLDFGYNGANILPVRFKQMTESVGWPTHPVITECVLACGIAADQSSVSSLGSALVYDVVLYYYLFLDVWNPYAIPLATGGTSPDIEVRVTGLPQVNIPNTNVIMPDEVVIAVDVFFDMEAGEVQLLAEPTDEGGSSGNGVNHVKIGQLITLGTQAAPAPFVSFSPTTVTLEFFNRVNPDSTEPFFTMTLGEYENFGIQYGPLLPFIRAPGSVAGGTNRVDTISRESLREPGHVFAYHFKMRDRYNTTDQGLSEWLEMRDPRASGHEIDITASDTYYEFLQQPTHYVRDSVTHVSDFFASAFANVVTGLPDRQARLFDVPVQAPVSVGTLRNLYFKGNPPFALGSVTGGELNLLYDRYFMSTLPEVAADWDKQSTLPNSRIVYLAEGGGEDSTDLVESEDSAKRLFLKNGFNLNSVSEVAWKAVLSGIKIPDWTYHDTTEYAPASGEVVLVNGLFSLPHRAAQNWPSSVSYADANNFEMETLADDRRHPVFIQGVRELTDAEVEALARRIVDQLKQRGEPFLSVADFLKAGILQNAIDAVPTINNPNGRELPIPQNAPASVTQSSLMVHLAPILFARSDTFTIRAYGDVQNPKTGEVEASAFCEATVQRVPEPMGGDAELYGRRYEIVSFAWLEEDFD